MRDDSTEREKQRVKTTMLSQMLAASREAIPLEANRKVRLKQNEVEDRAFWSATLSPVQYFHQIYEQVVTQNQYMKDIQRKVKSRDEKIVHEILEGEFELIEKKSPIPKKKMMIFTERETERLKGNGSRSMYFHASAGKLDKSAADSGLTTARDEGHRSLQREKSEQLTTREFLLNLRKQQSDFKARVQEYKKKEELKKIEVQSIMSARELDKKKTRHEDLLAKFVKKREEEKARMEEMQKSAAEFLEFQKNFSAKKPLYKIMEEKFSNEQAVQSQQSRLKQLRDIYKPHKLEDFEDHQKKYKEFQEAEERRMAVKRNEFAASRRMSIDPNLWRGKAHAIVEEEIQTARQKMISHSQDRREQKMRERTYSSLVKDNFRPVIDESKRREIILRNDDLQLSKVIQQKKEDPWLEEQKSLAKLNKIGHDNFEYAKKFARQHRKSSETYPDSAAMSVVSMGVEEAPRQPRVIYKNYMREERVKAKIKRDDPKREWEQHIMKYEGPEKVAKVLMAASQLDQQAARKEQLMKHSKTVSSNQIEELDDCYYNSIKAKIALLKELHKA